MEVVAHILTWNGERSLPEVLRSLGSQTKRATVRVVDNGSTDGTLSYLQEHAPQLLVARNVKNLGFATGHNQLLKFTLEKIAQGNPDEQAILLLKQDVVLDPLLLEKLLEALVNDPEIGAVQPKVFRLYPPEGGDDSVDLPVKTDILDTTGCMPTRAWRLIDRGAGEIDRGQYDEERVIFGARATVALFRASALLDVMEGGEVFDSSFFSYREDDDLAARLLRRGWKAVFLPEAKAWHYRGALSGERKGRWQQIRERRRQRPFPAALSLRNQYLFLLKNVAVIDLLRSLPSIFVEEGGRLCYALFLEKETRGLLFSSLSLFFQALQKRREIFLQSRTDQSFMRTFFRS